MLKKFIIGVLFAFVLLACVVKDTTEKSIIEVVQYQWWRLDQANLFITEDACFYVDPNNLYLYIHYLDSGNYWTYDLEYDLSKDTFVVQDTSFSFYFQGTEEEPEVMVKYGLIQKKSNMSLCYPPDTFASSVAKKVMQVVSFVVK